jgi:PAS domain S-box-containing protein
MGNSQFSLLRHVIEGQAEKPVDAVNEPVAPDLAASFPTIGTPVAPHNTPESAPPSPRPALLGPTPRTAAHSGHMKLLFDNAPVAMAMFDTEMRYLLANRRWLEDFKLTKVDVTGRSQYDLFPSLHPGWRHVYNRALGGQVVRSDRDSITQDGKPIIYRWEVRPWRHMDTTIGGVTISCERLYQGQAGAAVDAAAVSPEPQKEHGGIWKTKQPLLAVTDKGRILRVSDGLAVTVPDLTNEEEPVFFWDVFAEAGMHAPVRRATLVALDAVISGSEVQASVFTYPVQELEDVLVPSPPIQWLVSRLSEGLPGVEGEVALIVGLHGATPTAKSAVVSEEEIPAASSHERDQFIAEIARLHQAQKEAVDATAVSRQREARLRAVLELAPCGLMVIDEHARAIYQNAQVPGLLGRNVPEWQPMHEWLAEGARDDQHRAEIVRLWTEEVWRKRSTIPMPLTGGDGLHREVEMRPVPLPGGGLLLMLQDVTESRRSEEMLRSTEAKFRTLVHENPLPVVLADRSGAVFDVNPACEQLLGHTRAEMRRMPLERWLDAESLSRRAAVLQEMTKRGERFTELPVQVIHAKAYAFAVQMRLAVVPDASGQPMFTLHFFSPAEQPVTAEAPTAPLPPGPMEMEMEIDDEEHEEQSNPIVMTAPSSSALADAAARMKSFAPARVTEEAPMPEAEVEAEAKIEEPAQSFAEEPAITSEPDASTPVDEAPEASSPEPAAAPAVDPWRAEVDVEPPTALDPWRAPQGPAAPPVALDPWRAPEVASPAAQDPWSAPQAGFQSTPPPAPEIEPIISSESEVEPVSVPPLATTPVQDEVTAIEELTTTEREPEPEYELRPVPLISTDVHGRITAWTGEAESRFGFSEGEVLGRGMHSLFRPSDATGFHGEILALPGWETGAPASVMWRFFHKTVGRQESPFILLPLAQGGLALIVQEYERVAVTRSEPEVPASPEPLVQPELHDPIEPYLPVTHADVAALLDAPRPIEEPFEAQPAPAVHADNGVSSFGLDVDDEVSSPPPPFLDELDSPDEWPAVPANLLEDTLAPAAAKLEPAPVSSFAQASEEAFVSFGKAPVAPAAAPVVAPLNLAPPQRMFADTPPPPPKPLSLVPAQSLFKDAAVDASLSVPPPSSAPEPISAESSASPAPPQQRPSSQELQRERLLLGETHHRVKNHLQIITSMLNLQMSTLHNEEARDALRSSQNRVRSIAALHQHLYLLTTGESADFRAFATGLISHLRECYHVPADRVMLALHIPDRTLPEEWLMPLALALNEMVSNAFKHAWPDERPGSMRVSLYCGETEDGVPYGRLTVVDDGVGLADDFENRDHPGMGMKILRVFAGQLGGEVKMRPGNTRGQGVSFELVFPAGATPA